MGPQKSGALGIEEVRVAAHFMNRPGRAVVLVETNVGSRVHLAIRTLHASAPDHVMKHVVPTNSRPAATDLGNVIDFSDLNGRHVPVVVDRDWHALNLAPPVGRVGLHDYFL